MATTEHRSPNASRASVFARILVGVDGTESGFEACRQAALLKARDGLLELCCAVRLAEASRTGWSAPRVAEELRREAEEALEEAAAIAGAGAAKVLVEGPATASLLREAVARDASLIALGTHGHSRASEILLGGTAGAVLHEAGCSVLIARPPGGEGSFPGAIVAGIDGSPEGERALAVAQELAGRFGASLRVLTGLRGKGVDLARVRLQAPFVETFDEHPVQALLRGSIGADLLVVGSRGLHGLSALGSVGERVAHRAPCSVLVLRDRQG